MALAETLAIVIEKVSRKDIDSIAASLQKVDPPKKPPHVDNINLLTSVMVEKEVNELQQTKLIPDQPASARKSIKRVFRLARS